MAVTAAHPSGVNQLVDGLAHNQEDVGSSPTPATSDGSTGTSHSYKTGNYSMSVASLPRLTYWHALKWEGHHMSNWGFEDNDVNGLGNSTEVNGPKALRDAYDKQKQQLDDLTQKLTSFMEREEKQQMATVFESLGVPGAQSVYQGPNDPQKVKEWVDTMRQTFGGGQPQQAAIEQPITPTLPPSMQSQFERLSQAGNEGVPVGNVEAAQAAVNDATENQAIINAFRNLGA